MTKPKAAEIPMASKLADEPRDWFDAYEIVVDDPGGNLDTWRICEIFLDRAPWWPRFLFWLRNAAVRCVGLKAESVDIDRARELLETCRTKSEDEFPLELGVVGAKVFSASEREITAGADDWHLDFRGSLFVEPAGNTVRVTLSTTVRFRHWFGRLYFLPVKPFHKLIVRNMLSRLVRQR